MNRPSGAAWVSLLTLWPLTVAATPTPSPSLETVLAAAPSGFEELTSAPFHGRFSAHDYAVASDQARTDEIENTLTHDGFVDGYGKTWIHAGDRHALVEAVLAFTGARGARAWLTSAEAGDKADPSYDHPVTITGITPYYGGHFKYSSDNTQGDVFSFVKGNDVFIVGVVSTRDDALNLAVSQTKIQYDKAPTETIPSSQWPENANRSTAAGFPLLAVGLVGGLVVLAIVAVLAVALRRRGAMPPAVAGTGMAGAVQMSEDGNYWWDGQTWRDAAHDVPPSAQRSSDGSLWWDGRAWRPVPQGGRPAEPSAPPPA